MDAEEGLSYDDRRVKLRLIDIILVRALRELSAVMLVMMMILLIIVMMLMIVIVHSHFYDSPTRK